MANVVKLYYTQKVTSPDVDIEWELLPHKLLIVEDLETRYLAGKSKTIINDFQYVKNALELELNVDLSQTYSQPLTNKAIQYVSVQNEGEEIHYYFVKKATWRSKSCVRLELVMDVLNTFQENRDYFFKANTKINREHKDRFLIKNEKRYLTIKFDDYNVITSDPPQTEAEASIVDGEEVIFTGILYQYLEEGDTYQGFILEIPNTDTRSDEEILALFRNWEQDDTFSLIDEDNFELEFYFVGIPFADVDLPEINKEADVYRNIDKTPENIVPLLVCDNLSAENVNHHKNTLRGDWYLLYRNQNDPSESLVNPVECFLIPDKQISTAYGYIANGRIIPSWLEYGKFYYFRVVDNSGDPIRTYTLSNGTTISDSDTSHKTTMVISKASDNKISVQVVRAIYNSTTEVIGNYITEYITANSVPCKYNVDSSFWASTYTNYYTNITYPNTFNNSGTENKLDPITALDRTDAKNIKLIKLPYCPYDFSVSGSTIQVSADWDFVSLTQSGGGIINCLKLIDLHTKLEGKIEDTQFNPFDYLYFNKLSNIPLSINHLREQGDYESKLYHSEFFTPTFYYDSFAFKFELEKCDLFHIFEDYTKTSIKNDIKFDMTKTINSKFMFTFDNYEVFDNAQNYAKYLPIARNNEEVLYNVPYINYIRTGYGYDVKNKNISNISNALGVGLSAGSLAVSLAIPSAPLKVAGVVGSLVSMAMSVKNAVVSAVQNDNSLKQKITQYQNQTTNVAGSDDVDLMSIYAENRLKYLEYQPRQEIENVIFDLFFYAGYKSERMGIPNHNTRVNFDYLECDASIQKITTIPSDCLEELINSFKNGVTYMHYIANVYLRPHYDFEQKYENWEKIFFE